MSEERQKANEAKVAAKLRKLAELTGQDPARLVKTLETALKDRPVSPQTPPPASDDR